MHANTQNAPRNGGKFVIILNVGIAQSPPTPTISIIIFCQRDNTESSPRYMLSAETTSTFPISNLVVSKLTTQRLANDGNNKPAENSEAVTTPLTQSINDVMSPITVHAPPKVAEIIMTHAYTVL